MKVKVTQSCWTRQSLGLYSLWNSTGQNTGVGSLSLLQWIFPTQELNRGLLHCSQILYQLSGKQDPIPKSESRELLGVPGSHPVPPEEPDVLGDPLMSQPPRGPQLGAPTYPNSEGVAVFQTIYPSCPLWGGYQ